MCQHLYIFHFDPGYNGWSRLGDPFARWLCVGGMVGGACAVAVFNDGECLAMGERVGVFLFGDREDFTHRIVSL